MAVTGPCCADAGGGLVRVTAARSISRAIADVRIASMISPPAQLEPRHREVDAPQHCEHGNHPHPARPEPPCPSLGQQRGDRGQRSALRARPWRSSRTSTSREPGSHRGCHCVSGVMGPQKDDAERGIDGEQREIQLERDHVEDRERGPVGKCEPAKPRRARHASEAHDVVQDVTDQEAPPDDEGEEQGQRGGRSRGFVGTLAASTPNRPAATPTRWRRNAP